MTAKSENNIARIAFIGIAALGALLLAGQDGAEGNARVVYMVVAAAIALATAWAIILRVNADKSLGPEAAVAVLSVLGLGAAVVTGNCDCQSADEDPAVVQPDEAAPAKDPDDANDARPPHIPPPNQAAPSPDDHEHPPGTPPDHEHPHAPTPPPNPMARQVDAILNEAGQAFNDKDFALAEQKLIEVQPLLKEHFPDNMELQGRVLFSLSEARFNNGRVDEAIKALEERLAMLRAAAQPDADAIAKSLDRIGTMLGTAKRYADSVTWFQKAISEQTKAKADEQQIAFTQVNLALSLWRSDQKAKAVPLFKKAKKTLTEKLPPDHAGLKRIEAIAAELGL
ncbi:MAG: tetratricopeptide repeat protein [Proteobacteria bacterium]|nr:tetratricopeptide repeat protein [Pseudomonadota bacterium]